MRRLVVLVLAAGLVAGCGGGKTVTVTTTRTVTRTVTITVAFAKSSPANNAKLARTTSTTLAWYAFSGAVGYRYCLTTSTKACTNWLTPSGGTLATSTAVTVAAGTTYYWQVQVQATTGGTWTAANAGTQWKFSVSR